MRNQKLIACLLSLSSVALVAVPTVSFAQAAGEAAKVGSKAVKYLESRKAIAAISEAKIGEVSVAKILGQDVKAAQILGNVDVALKMFQLIASSNDARIIKLRDSLNLVKNFEAIESASDAAKAAQDAEIAINSDLEAYLASVSESNSSQSAANSKANKTGFKSKISVNVPSSNSAGEAQWTYHMEAQNTLEVRPDGKAGLEKGIQSENPNLIKEAMSVSMSAIPVLGEPLFDKGIKDCALNYPADAVKNLLTSVQSLTITSSSTPASIRGEWIASLGNVLKTDAAETTQRFDELIEQCAVPSRKLKK